MLSFQPTALAATCDYSITAIGASTFVISDSGNWCIENNLKYTGNQSAIKVEADNVAIYFNGYLLDGPDSPHSQALGIEMERISEAKIVGNTATADDASVGGTISGFLRGISVIGGGQLQINSLNFKDNFQNAICIRDARGVTIAQNSIDRTGGHALTGDDLRSIRVKNCGSSPSVVGIFVGRGNNVQIHDNRVTTTIRNRLNKFYAYGIVANSIGASVNENTVINSQNIGIMTNLGYDSNAVGLGAQITGNSIRNYGDFQTFCQFHLGSAAYDLHNGIRMSGYLDNYSDNDVQGFYQPFWRGTDAGSNRDNGAGNDGDLIRLCNSLISP